MFWNNALRCLAHIHLSKEDEEEEEAYKMMTMMMMTMSMKQRRSTVNESNKWPLCCMFGLRFHFLRVWEPEAGAKKTLSPNWFVMWMRLSVRPRWSAAAAVAAAPLLFFFFTVFFPSFGWLLLLLLLLFTTLCAIHVFFFLSLFLYGFSVLTNDLMRSHTRSLSHRQERPDNDEMMSPFNP